MKYAKILTNDVINGDGWRVTLFVSGCSLHCPNCHNSKLQNKDYGEDFTGETAGQIADALLPKYIDGLTITGGHPLDPCNIDACTQLCENIKALYPSKTIWLYTGYVYDDIKNLEILDYIDVLIDGAYIEELKDKSLKWRGSSNQRVIDVKKTKKENHIVLWCD